MLLQRRNAVSLPDQYDTKYNAITLHGIRCHSIGGLRRKEGITIEQTSSVNANGKRTYSVDEVREILNVSRSKAYDICKSNVFKVIHIGRVMRVSKVSFDLWLDSENS